MMVSGCVKPYAPSLQITDNSYLVIDGLLNADSSSIIRLSRTRNLSDTTPSIPEKAAQVFIEGQTGSLYAFQSTAEGEYTSENSSLNPLDKYRLKIITANGKQYLSDYLEVKQTPDIDSLHWEQHDAIFIYVNTHDPSSQSRYYRWEFTETVEYHAWYESYLDFQNGQLVFLNPDQYRQICFKTFPSTDILVASSAALSEDVISHQLLQKIPNDNSKISQRYSIEVRQYVLTPDAYQFWQILKQNSEQTGGIFDPQPSQLKSNIHCTTNPQEPVIGFLSASSVKTKRLFIRNGELTDRKDAIDKACDPIIVADFDSLPYYLGSGALLPAYLLGRSGPIALAPNICVDCRLMGGVTKKPSFW